MDNTAIDTKNSGIIIDKDKPIYIEQDNSSDIIFPLIILIIFILFFGWIIYVLINSKFQTINNIPTINYLCGQGQCATNILSGFKSCPVSNQDTITYNPGEEVCNSRFVCDNPLTPYALLSDGSTDTNGVCEPNTTCSCLRTTQCPEFILSNFTTSNGNPYTTINNQRITFPQQSSVVTPIELSDPSINFCFAPVSWLSFSTPGCNFINGNNNVTYDDIVTCMGMSKGCNGNIGNACLQGTLAFITNNPDSITRDNINIQQMGCVRGESCDCGQITIFDTNYGGIVCRSL